MIRSLNSWINQLTRLNGLRFDAQWRTTLLRTEAAVVGLAALLDLPLLVTMAPQVSTYVLLGSLAVIVLCGGILTLASQRSVVPAGLLLCGVVMAYIVASAGASDLLYRSTGAALIVPIFLIGIITSARFALLFGVVSIAVLLGSSLRSGLPWTPYTFTNAFVIAITVGLLWLIQRLIKAVEQRNQELATYAAQTEYLANERILLAREIHDGIGHVLMTVNMQIEAARAHFETNPALAQETLITAQRYTKEAAAEIRRSIVGLRTPILQDALLTDTVTTLAATSRTTNLDVKIDIQGTPRQLTPQATFALNRIVQEALTNVRKHAQARLATITLDYSSERQMRVVVHDDGVGADQLGAGYGLIGIQERVEALGGNVMTQTSPDAGFTLSVEVPT